MRTLLTIAIVIGLSSAAAAQESSTSEPPPGFAVDFLRQNAEWSSQLLLERLSDPKYADALATATRNYYEALIKKGFTKPEALQIVMYSNHLRRILGP